MTLLHRERKHGDKIIVIDQTGSFSHNYRCFFGSNYSDLRWELFDESKMSPMQKLMTFSQFGSAKFYKPFDFLIRNNTCENYREIFVFNDTPLSIQSFISNMGIKEITYIEDGTAPYNSHYIYNSMYQKIIKKFFFGQYYDWKPILGTSKYIKSGLFTHKSFIRKENMIYPAKDFKCRLDYLLVINNFATILGLMKNVEEKLKSIVFFMPKIANEEDQLFIQLKKTMLYFAKKNWSVFVKYHPLNNGVNLIDTQEIDVQEIDSSVPAEIVPTMLHNIEIIVGMETTCLASIVFLYPSINEKVFSIVDKTHGDINLQFYFENIGINLISTPLKLIEKINFKMECISND
jgi:hypothetical protein